MPALNFKKQFAEAVESGKKTQTIRKGDRIKTGDDLYLYTGMRTKQCRLLHGPVKCLVGAIRITEDGVTVFRKHRGEDEARALTDKETLVMAKADGFDTVEEFMAFFRDNHGFPFSGQIIFWEV